MAGFKKRVVSAERVAAVESVTLDVPVVGDPRMQAVASTTVGSIGTLGSSQHSPANTRIYEIGQIYSIPVELIKSNPVNPRAVYANSSIDEMAASLVAHGQRVSATGYVGDQGDVFLIEGETRLRGARLANLPTLRIEIKARHASERELYEEARAANVERRDQTPLDDALRWKELLAKKVYPTQSSLAKALSIGEDHVSRTLSLTNLPMRVIHALAEAPELLNHKMLNALREYWEVKGDESTLGIILEAAKNSLGYRDIVARRKAAEKGPVKRPRSSREPLRYRSAKGEIKSFEEEGRVELSLKGLSAEDAKSVILKLKAVFSEETK